MTGLRITAITVFIGMCVPGIVLAQGAAQSTSAKQFGHFSVELLEDPLGENANRYGRAIMIFAMKTPKAAIVIGTEEITWIGENSKYSSLLFAAYMAGNTQSQLRSGVKRNDRYSGLLALFRVYRTLKKQDKKFQIAAVDALLKLHTNARLVKYLLELEQRKPTKLTPEAQRSLRKLLQRKN